MRYPISDGGFWAKRKPRTGSPMDWHPLADHCIDVAACCEALLGLPGIRARLAALAGVAAWPEVWTARLTLLAALHDFGKTNPGFQEQRRYAGHIKEAAVFAGNRKLLHAAGLEILGCWGIHENEVLAVMLAHHGEPPDENNANQF